jgi:hypothetical protein
LFADGQMSLLCWFFDGWKTLCCIVCLQMFKITQVAKALKTRYCHRFVYMLDIFVPIWSMLFLWVLYYAQHKMSKRSTHSSQIMSLALSWPSYAHFGPELAQHWLKISDKGQTRPNFPSPRPSVAQSWADGTFNNYHTDISNTNIRLLNTRIAVNSSPILES